MVERALIFTLGHGARPIDEFLAILRAASVTTLVDIRRFPGSRRHPQFGRDALATAVESAEIGYEWQGEALGGRRPARPGSHHTALRVVAFAGYADHMDTPAFRAAVDVLATRARASRLAIMCAERLWWQCHRMLVADALTMRAVEVIHLLDAAHRQPHRLHETVRRGADGWPVYDARSGLLLDP